MVDRPIELPERGPGTETVSGPARVRVDVDTWVERPDLAPSNRTFVAAGDLVPVGLESYPRGPA